MFVCHYERKKLVDDHRQKYVEITWDCLWDEIAEKHPWFLQTKHLQCSYFENNELTGALFKSVRENFEIEQLYMVNSLQIWM